MSDVTLYEGDCLEFMKGMEAGSVDAILTDIPYGTTACSWDEVIPLEPMWKQVKHVLKPNGVFVTTASQPFTSVLVCSNLEWFKYEWIWEKARATGHALCNKRPLKAHENIVIFYDIQPTYNPQKTKGNPYNGRRNPIATSEWNYGKTRNDNDGDRYPRSVFYEKTGDRNGSVHPTAKPIEVYEMLIKTYTNEGDTVLDICMGSGTTGVACVALGRDFIGVEKDAKYFSIAEKRINEVQKENE
jgi:site-specific DNA-methyltransferase (adenine-specific)